MQQNGAMVEWKIAKGILLAVLILALIYGMSQDPESFRPFFVYIVLPVALVWAVGAYTYSRGKERMKNRR